MARSNVRLETTFALSFLVLGACGALAQPPSAPGLPPSPSACGREAWETEAQTIRASRLADWIALCTTQLDKTPDNAVLAGTVAEMRVAGGTIDPRTQDLIDQAFSAGDTQPMLREVDALIASQQAARAEPLLRRLAAAGDTEGSRRYAKALFASDREPEGIAILDRLDFQDNAGQQFLVDLVESVQSPVFRAWWRNKAANLPASDATLQASLAKEFLAKRDRTNARYLFSLAAANGSPDGLSWVTHDLYDGSDATNLVTTLNRLGFDAGEPGPKLTERGRRAIAAFQAVTFLAVTYEPDESTLATLSLYSLNQISRVAPSGALSGIGRVTIETKGQGISRGTGFLAGDRCTVVFSAHTFEHVDQLGDAKFHLGPRTPSPYPTYSFDADIEPVAMGLVIVGDDVLPDPKTDWVVGRLMPCADSSYMPLTVLPNDAGLVHQNLTLYALGYPGGADASQLSVLACNAEFIVAIERQCLMRGMSGGPVLVDAPAQEHAGSVVGINTGVYVSPQQHLENVTPVFALSVPAHRAATAHALQGSERQTALSQLVRLGLLSSKTADDSELRRALIAFQDKYAQFKHPGRELWHDLYGRYYSLQLDEDFRELIDDVAHPGRKQLAALAGQWCGVGVSLVLAHSPSGWRVGTSKGALLPVRSIVTAGSFASLDAGTPDLQYSYEFYREPGAIDLIHVDATATPPGVPEGLNGVITLRRCAERE